MKDRVFTKSVAAGIILAFAGGGLDAYTYICRGGVFSSMQTGNILKFGISVAEGDFIGCSRFVLPIISFVLGVVFCEIISRGKNSKYFNQFCVFLEMLVFSAVAFIPKGNLDNLANCVISFVTAMQFNCFRKLDSLAVATTMCTGNLRSFAEMLTKVLVEKKAVHLKKATKYFLIIMSFFLGAVTAAFAEKFIGLYSISVSAVSLFIFLIYYSAAKLQNEF